MPLPKISPPTLGHSGHCPDYSFYYFLFTINFYYFTWNGPEMFVDLDLPTNASSPLSASAELLVTFYTRITRPRGVAVKW